MNHYVSRNTWNACNRRMRPVPVSLVRRDIVTAQIVEEGIALQQQAGTKFAAVFLDYKGVSVDIALRVLLHPAERRKMGAPNISTPVFSS